MADQTEILQAIKTLRAAHPNFQPPDPAALLELWTRKLAHLRPGLLTEAADLLIDRSRFFPSLSELLDRDLLHAADLRLQERARPAYPIAIAHTLIAEKIQLIEAYWTDGSLDPAAWQALIDRFAAQGWETGAEDLRLRLARFSEQAG